MSRIGDALVFAVFAALFFSSFAGALNYDPNKDDLQLSFLTPQHLPYDASDTTTKGSVIMLSSRLSNPFGDSVGAAPGNNVNRVYLVISNAAGRASVGDVYYYQDGYYRKKSRTADTTADTHVDYVYSTTNGVMPVLQSVRIAFNPYNGETGQPDYSDFVITIPEYVDANNQKQGAWFYDVGYIDSLTPTFSLTTGEPKNYYSTDYPNTPPQQKPTPFTSPRGSVGSVSTTAASIAYALTFNPPIATATPTTNPTVTPRPNCVYNNYMKIGDSLTLGNKRLVLKDISGMPYGTTYTPSASFDLFELNSYDLTSTGTKIDTLTYPKGGKYQKNGVIVYVNNVYLGTGGSAYAQVELCPEIAVTTPTPTSVPRAMIPPECKTVFDMKIGQYAIHQPTYYEIHLKDISGMPYGSTYSSAASYDIYDNNRNKIDTATLWAGQEYNKNGVRFGVSYVSAGASENSSKIANSDTPYARTYFCPSALLPTVTVVPTVTPTPPNCVYKEFMQTGNRLTIGNKYALVLTDISGMPYGTTYAPSASFNLFELNTYDLTSTGTQIVSFTIKEGGEYNNKVVTVRLKKAFVGTGGNAYAYVEMCSKLAVTTPTPTAIPSPAPSYCNIMYNIILSPPTNGAETCGFKIMPTAFESYPTPEYKYIMKYEVNGKEFQTAKGYASTITTTEGGRALYLLMGDEFTSNSALVAKIIPFERYFKNLRQGQTVTFADGEVITVISAGASTQGCGRVVFDVTPASSVPEHARYEMRTGEYAGIGKINAYVFGVSLDGSITVGFTPSEIQLPAPGVISDQPNGLKVYSGSNSIYCDANKPRNEKAPILYRTVKRCGTRNTMGDPQIINLEYGYGNYKCASREKEQCYDDNNFDAYYQEGCFASSNANSNNPIQQLWNAIWPSQNSDTENPPLPPNEIGITGNQFEVKLNAGWNLVSAPLIGKIIKTDCAGTTTLWHWNGASYETPGKISGGAGVILTAMKGYWAFVPNDCSFVVEGSAAVSVEGTALRAGVWNHIGGPLRPVSFNSVSRGCSVSSGLWEYNGAAQKYVKAGALQPGKGYFVKVAADCVLAETDETMPPALPAESEDSSSVAAAAQGTGTRSTTVQDAATQNYERQQHSMNATTQNEAVD